MEPTPIIDSLRWRYATKQFDPERKLTADQLGSLLESLRLTASSFGLQPWRFVVVSDPATRAELQTVSWNQPQVTDCSHLIVLCRIDSVTGDLVRAHIDKTAETQGTPIEKLATFEDMILGFLSRMSEEQKTAWATNQIYIAMGNLLAACAATRIDACPMEGLDAAAYDRILDLPAQGCHAILACPVGFRSETDKY
ncbi:MAG: NAD(P)H-dependent oxidoreductase, partial [Verrucomicrobiales bacterium]|nr:NAD(P)H-dependent oxidoreductase [Verrucomicrobiales bacterium]